MRSSSHAPATPAHWTTRGPLACALRPLAALYGAAAAFDAWRYRQGWRHRARLPVPVIVVGNVVAGGAGKTPTTLALVRHLQQRGWTPGIVSRGYGRRGDAVRGVSPGDAAEAVGDEPLLLARQLPGVPVFVGRRRADAGLALLRAHPQVDLIVCDDGLQHHALARDVEICVFDERGLGNGWLIPAGPLREPWPRRGASADKLLVLHTGREVAPALSGTGWHAARRLASHAHDAQGQHWPLAQLAARPLLAVAGIARPQAFFDMLAQAGVRPQRSQGFPDHYAFQPGDFDLADGATVLCTEKDAVKIWPFMPDALAVGLTLDVPAAFWATLDRRLQAFR
ncbi:MAG: tetraacyldisaccharide 4'-kinase [Comamonas sp.]